jgi:hypothetical protein
LSDTLTLTQALSMFDEAEELSLDSRAVSERCKDYYDGKQWTPEEQAALRKRRQPCIVRNRIKPKVDFLKGLETQTRTDPKAFPRTPGDDDAASAATDAIRFVCDQQKYINTKSACFENLTIEGTCGVEVYAKEGRKGDIDICIKRYQWDRLGWDPHSREKDFSDAAYRYGVAWMDHDQAVLRYPDREEVLSQTYAHESTLATTYDDAPRIKWADTRRKRVRVVKLEWKVGDEVYVCEFTRGGFLSDPEPSPWVDEDGKPEWSIIMQSAHVDRDGNRYGWVQAWLDLQDEINKRASKFLHLASVRQTFSNRTAGEDVNEFRKQLARPDGHLTFNAGEFGKDFGVIPSLDLASAQFQIQQEAMSSLDSVGVNAALSGADQRGLSGKAIGRLQQGGSTEIKPLLDCQASFNQQVYRAVWNRIKQFWTAEKWIRVTDDENNLQLMEEQQAQDPSWQLPPEYANDPRLNEVVEVKNEVTRMDVDIIIEEVPDTITVQQEQFEALTALFPAVPDMQKPAMLEMLIQSSTLRDKSRLLDKLNGAGEQQDPAAAEAAAAQNAMQQEHQAALLDEIRSKTEKNRASAAKELAAAEGSQLQTLSTISQAEGDFEREQQMNMEGQPMM